MYQQASTPVATPKLKGGAPYRIERRTKKKRGSGQLSGYAVDITIRVNHQGAYFLEDHNSTRDAMPHNNRDKLIVTLVDELERNHREHFGLESPEAQASEGVRLLATQVALAGSSREETEDWLHNEFGVSDAGPLLDEIFAS